MGSKLQLAGQIFSVAGIKPEIIRGTEKLLSLSVAARMFMAARRQTSRDEDQAYSLLGIFDVNMPLLYGEGGEKAFYRLQEEIVRQSAFADHSVLAWQPWSTGPVEVRDLYPHLLSSSPYGFRHAQNVVSWIGPGSRSLEITQNSLRLDGHKIPFGSYGGSVVALNCRYADQPMTHICLELEPQTLLSLPTTRGYINRFPNKNEYRVQRLMLEDEGLLSVSVADLYDADISTLSLAKGNLDIPVCEPKLHLSISDVSLSVIRWWPMDCWNPKLHIFDAASATFIISDLDRFAERTEYLALRIASGCGDTVIRIEQLERESEDCESNICNIRDCHTRCVRKFKLQVNQTAILRKEPRLELTVRHVVIAEERLWSLGIHTAR